MKTSDYGCYDCGSQKRSILSGFERVPQGLMDGQLSPSGLCGVVEHRSLAISTGSFRPSPTMESVNRIAKLGFKHVEITVQDSELNYDFYRRMAMDYFEELQDLVHELGLRVTSLHAPHLQPSRLSAPGPDMKS